MAIYYTVFVGKADALEVRLFESNRPADLSTVTRVTLLVGDFLIDSDNPLHEEYISWSIATEYDDETTGVVTFTLGTILVDPMSYTAAYLTTYDPGVPGGYLWEENCSDTELYIEVCSKASL